MATISVSQYRVQPGKNAAFVALRQELKALAAKHGFTVRLFAATLAGPAVGTYSTVLEATDAPTWAANFQKLFDDPAYQALMARTVEPDGVATLVSFSQANEVPL